MPIKSTSSCVTSSVYIDCLKLFQEHPEQFPLDLRAKFCFCNKSRTKIIHQQSDEFVSKPNNDSKQLGIIAEELKNMLQQRLISQESQISLNHKIEYQDKDILKLINYLISRPEKIPIKAVNRLCKITASLSLPKFKSSREHFYNQDSTAASETFTKTKKEIDTRRNKSSTSPIRIHTKHKRSNKSPYRFHISTSSSHHSKTKKHRSRRKHKYKRARSRSSRKKSKSSLKLNEQHETITQPVIITEKLVKHQPIPLVIFRLCCPPGMIPLTAKVAERLGININKTDLYLKNHIH